MRIALLALMLVLAGCGDLRLRPPEYPIPLVDLPANNG